MSRPPRRNAAIIASMRIHIYYQKSYPNINQKDLTRIVAQEFPRTCQILATQEYVQTRFNEINLYPEKKIENIINIFQHLITYPIILLVHPAFREIIMRKMDEFELYIHRMSELKKKIDDVEDITRHGISHKIVKDNIITHLNTIRFIHSEYQKENNTAQCDRLQPLINNLRSVMKVLHYHPDYISK